MVKRGKKSAKGVDFDWAEEYASNEGWAAVRNPELEATRQQKIAKIVLGLIMVSLPVSVGSCVVALSAATGGDDAELVEPYQPPWEAVRHIQAEQAVQLWAENAGGVVDWVGSLNAAASDLVCDGVPCERHQVGVHLSEGSNITVEVLIHPSDGSVIAYPYPLVWEPPSQNEGSGLAATNGEINVDTWSASEGVTKTDLPNPTSVAAELEKWAVSWVNRDTDGLQRLSGLEDLVDFWLPPVGLEYVPNTIQIVDWVDFIGDSGRRVATVRLQVKPPVSERGCISSSATDVTPNSLPQCLKPVWISADIQMVAKEGQVVRVESSSPTGRGGSGNPDSSLPAVGNRVWSGR